MNVDPNASKDLLNSLFILSDRLTHSTLSPLSVLVGLIEDLLGGYAIERRDIEDAAIACRRIREHLATLEELSSADEKDFEDESFVTYIQRQAPIGFGFGRDYRVEASIEDGISDQYLVTAPTARALRAIMRYALSIRTLAQLPFSCNLSVTENKNLLVSFVMLITSREFLLEVRKATTLGELAAIDHKLSAMNLIFAEHLLRLNGLTSSVNVTSSGVLSLNCICQKQGERRRELSLLRPLNNLNML